jgi:hypothetical protein
MNTYPASTQVPRAQTTGTAETILAERFARGEMSAHDFVTTRAVLRGEAPPENQGDMP